MAKPENAATIEEFIYNGKTTTLSYDALSFKNSLSNGTLVTVLNVIDDYIEELRERAILISMSVEEYRKYKYKPKLLSIDLYGNPELYFIILLINDMADVKEFDKRNIYLLRKNTFFELLSNIYNAEKKVLDIYNEANT